MTTSCYGLLDVILDALAKPVDSCFNVVATSIQHGSSNQLDVPSFRLPTVGSRAFPNAGAKVWNSLPDDVSSTPSLSTFRCHLKTHLFRCCYNIL